MKKSVLTEKLPTQKAAEFKDGYIRDLRHNPNGRNQYTDLKCPGLMVEVTSRGMKTFRFRMRLKGRKRRRSERLGAWGTRLTVAVARKEANELRQLWQEEARKGKRAKVDPVPTLAELIPLYEKARRGKDLQASKFGKPLPKAWAGNIALARDIFARLLELPMNEIFRQDLLDGYTAYLDEREKDSGKRPEATVRSNFATIRPMLRWACKKHWMHLEELMDLVAGTTKSRTRFLLPGEWQVIAPVVDAMADEAGLFMRFLLATGCRTNMALTMTWRDLEVHDLIGPEGDSKEVMIWTIPEHLMKKGDLAILPIVGEARRIVDHLGWNERNKTRDTVFPSVVIQRWKSNGPKLRKAIHEATDTHHWHNHDVRRTVATWLGYAHADYKTVGRALSHKHATEQKGTVTDIYLHSTEVRILADAYERLHQLVKDVELGRVSPMLAAMQSELPVNLKAKKFMADFAIDRAFMKVKPAILRAVA